MMEGVIREEGSGNMSQVPRNRKGLILLEPLGTLDLRNITSTVASCVQKRVCTCPSSLLVIGCSSLKQS